MVIEYLIFMFVLLIFSLVVNYLEVPKPEQRPKKNEAKVKVSNLTPTREMDPERDAMRVVRLPYDTMPNLTGQFEAGVIDSIEYELRSERL